MCSRVLQRSVYQAIGQPLTVCVGVDIQMSQFQPSCEHLHTNMTDLLQKRKKLSQGSLFSVMHTSPTEIYIPSFHALHRARYPLAQNEWSSC